MTPDLADRTYVVTGANAGIGRVTARELARRGATVILACRSEDKTRPAIDDIRALAGHDRVRFVELDLASLASVAACADRLRDEGPIHGLINNAGLTATQGDRTADGFELTFGVNHLGHFALTLRLLDRLSEGRARVVNVSSKSHYDADDIDFAALRQPRRPASASANTPSASSATSSSPAKPPAASPTAASPPTRSTPASSPPRSGAASPSPSAGS
ncbi:MAG: SDR family NAD(P)-dependent oxidoreductase [bacterium]